MPTNPTVLFVSSIPVISGGAILSNPSSLHFASHTDIFLLTVSIKPTISSATEFVLADGVLSTVIPYSPAASRSIVLQPTPCFPITFKCFALAIISLLTSAVRRITASISSACSKESTTSALFLSKASASGWMYSLKYTTIFFLPVLFLEIMLS